MLAADVPAGDAGRLFVELLRTAEGCVGADAGGALLLAPAPDDLKVVVVGRDRAFAFCSASSARAASAAAVSAARAARISPKIFNRNRINQITAETI